VSEIVQKTICRFYGSCFDESSLSARGRQNRLIRLGAIAGMRLRSKYELPMVQVMHTYDVRLRKDKRGVNLISDALPFGRLWYTCTLIESHERSALYRHSNPSAT
jgi:hypothetical protein